MIIKGGSRAAPGQLAWHLQRRDTNERVEILELQSPAPDLAEAFRDWQILSEGTRGTKGLYHANIDPAKDYTMTRDQWQRAVDVLEKELGFEGQPRAVVMHEKYGREHIHVVWARTDIDQMVLRSDSQNYLAHERASQALEEEFGHEHVPGKHAKRDRDKQPEFPNAVANQAEWQQGERTGIDAATRKDQITALKQACDNGQAFKTALEEQGYILAKGDRRDFVIVDETGSIHSLGRQIQGMKAAELRAFMKDVDRETLPTAAQATELQRQHKEEIRQEERQQQEPQQQKPEQHEPQQQETKEQHETAPQETQPQETQKQTPNQPEAEPEPTPTEPVSDPIQAQTEALRKAVTERQAEERRRLVESQTDEMDQLREALDRDTREKLDRFDAIHREEIEGLQADQKEARSGFAGFMDSVQNLFSPDRAAEREAERQREHEELAARQKQERDDYAALLQQTNELEIENLTERQALSLHDHAVRGEEDLNRYIRELEAARELQAEIEERERQREEELARDALEKPPPTRAR
jgi:hypothetical protein